MTKIKEVLKIGNPKINEVLLKQVITSREFDHQDIQKNVNSNKIRRKKERQEMRAAVLERMEENGPLWSRESHKHTKKIHEPQTAGEREMMLKSKKRKDLRLEHDRIYGRVGSRKY